MPPVLYHEGRFPPTTLDWPRLIPLLGPAITALARYDGMLTAVPNPAVLLSPLTTQEAVLSSRIEGTQATMEEVLEFEAGQEPATPERHDDIQEVLNYRAAMREAERLLATLPLSQRVIRRMHEVLLSGVRGQNKSPGEYRKIPNWIGPPGSSIEEAHFVPIGTERLPDALSAGKTTSMRRRWTSSCNSPCSMRSLKRCIPSLTATAVSGACWSRSTSGKAA